MIERDLASRTPVEYQDAESQTETAASIAVAEAIVGARLDLPKKGIFTDIANQPNISTESNYQNDEDEEVSETLSSIQASEKLYGYRADNSWNRWGGNGRSGNGGRGYNNRAYGYGGHNVPENKDWWN